MLLTVLTDERHSPAKPTLRLGCTCELPVMTQANWPRAHVIALVRCTLANFDLPNRVAYSLLLVRPFMSRVPRKVYSNHLWNHLWDQLWDLETN